VRRARQRYRRSGLVFYRCLTMALLTSSPYAILAASPLPRSTAGTNFRKWESGTHMPYSITMEPTFLRIVLRGAVTNQDLQALADALVTIEMSSAVTPHRLTDLSAVTEPQLTYPAVRAWAERRKAQMLANPVKSALVAPRPILLGFARMFQTLNEHPQITIEIFATVESAEAWLRSK
jgi:hypothetical protein